MGRHRVGHLPDLSDVTRILSLLDDCFSSSFSLKYSSTHCCSNSCRLFSSSALSTSSVDTNRTSALRHAAAVADSAPGLTEAPLPLVVVGVGPLKAAAAQPPQDDVDVGKDDEGGRQDRTVVEGHDQLIPLELPHLVGDGLHLEEGVAVEKKSVEASLGNNVLLRFKGQIILNSDQNTVK